MKEGDFIPAFRLSDGFGREWTEGDFAEKWLALFFYSKNNTSG